MDVLAFVLWVFAFVCFAIGVFEARSRFNIVSAGLAFSVAAVLVGAWPIG